MGLWSGIKYALNSSLGTAQFKPLDQQIAALKADVAALQGKSAIKNIQRISFADGTGAGSITKTITISAVNPAKTVLNAVYVNTNDPTNWINPITVTLKSATVVEVYAYNTNYSGGYEVIEYN